MSLPYNIDQEIRENTYLVVSPMSLQKSSEAELLPHAQVSGGAHTFPRVYRDFNHHGAFWVFGGRLQPKKQATQIGKSVLKCAQ